MRRKSIRKENDGIIGLRSLSRETPKSSPQHMLKTKYIAVYGSAAVKVGTSTQQFYCTTSS